MHPADSIRSASGRRTRIDPALGQPGRYTDGFTRAPVTLPADGRLEIPAHGYLVLVR
ncbi:MAG: hypothetical protein KY467_06480 [Gemmatimonadetes bacterium]|nr:hypothetical protein [Gemmatimonadota bacterium]